jgi:hypothetical protein
MRCLSNVNLREVMSSADQNTDELPLRVLLASSTWWSSAAKLALAFLRIGCKVEVVCARDHPFYFIRGITRIHDYHGLNSIKSLYEAIISFDPDMVVPCDDSVVLQLQDLYRTKPEIRQLIERSLGIASSYEIVAGRAELMKTAQELHIRTPKTVQVENAASLQEWFSVPGASGVLKTDRTSAGKSVNIVHSVAEAEKAMLQIHRSSTIASALARWLLNNNAAAFWNWRNKGKLKFSLQEFIPGVPANAMMACWNGKVLAMVTVEVLCAQGWTGPSLVVKLIENREIRTSAERLTQRLQISGFYGLDFILEAGTGDAYLIELNPRCTQLGHLQIAGQGDLAEIFCAAFAGLSFRPTQEPIRQTKIAFFPQALLSNPICPYLKTAYSDVPWDEPSLVREMMRRDWRERNLLVRAYYALRPPRRPVTVFEHLSTAELQGQKASAVSAKV